jgi:hypothetical protein
VTADIQWRSLVEHVRLIKQIDGHECVRRNALTKKPAVLVLPAGSIGIVVETFGSGDEFLVEFGNCSDQCDWLGVLYEGEIQRMPMVAKAA